jgi:uncharacterized membrane protein YccC
MNDNINAASEPTIFRTMVIVVVLLIGLLGLFMSLCGGVFLFDALFHQGEGLMFWPIAAVCTGIGVALVWLCGKYLWRRWDERRAAAKAAR